MFSAVNYRLVLMTSSGCTVLFAWSKALTKACFSAELSCITFLLTGEMERDRERSHTSLYFLNGYTDFSYCFFSGCNHQCDTFPQQPLK